MWHRRWTLATLLFFLNRYVLIALVPLTFIDASTSAVSSTRSIVGSVSDLSFRGLSDYCFYIDSMTLTALFPAAIFIRCGKIFCGYPNTLSMLVGCYICYSESDADSDCSVFRTTRICFAY